MLGNHLLYQLGLFHGVPYSSMPVGYSGIIEIKRFFRPEKWQINPIEVSIRKAVEFSHLGPNTKNKKFKQQLAGYHPLKNGLNLILMDHL